jgi:hypothetical protein
LDEKKDESKRLGNQQNQRSSAAHLLEKISTHNNPTK